MVFDFIDDGEGISQALVAQTYHHHPFFSLYCMVFDANFNNILVLS